MGLVSEFRAVALPAVDILADVSDGGTEIVGVVCSEVVIGWLPHDGLGSHTRSFGAADGGTLRAVVVERSYTVDLVCADCQQWTGFGGNEADAAAESEEKNGLMHINGRVEGIVKNVRLIESCKS